MTEPQTQRVAIVVLGEIGQSPRMQLHARALVDHGLSVDVVAYGGDATPAWLRKNPRIGLWALPAPGWAQRHQLPPFSHSKNIALSAEVIRHRTAYVNGGVTP